MEEADKDWMIRMVGGWVFLLVPAHLGSPGQRAVKRLLLLLFQGLEIWQKNPGIWRLIRRKLRQSHVSKSSTSPTGTGSLATSKSGNQGKIKLHRVIYCNRGNNWLTWLQKTDKKMTQARITTHCWTKSVTESVLNMITSRTILSLNYSLCYLTLFSL